MQPKSKLQKNLYLDCIRVANRDRRTFSKRIQRQSWVHIDDWVVIIMWLPALVVTHQNLAQAVLNGAWH